MVVAYTLMGGFLAVAWTAASSLASHPHYLAYANELIGGSRNARHYFAESNLDWGQDARTLARFLQKQGNPAVHLAFSRSAMRNVVRSIAGFGR